MRIVMMAETSNQPTCCGAAPKVIFACSGASDVGEITDLAARKLAAEGAATMLCLAAFSGRVSGMVASAEAALAGWCPRACPIRSSSR